LLPSWAESQGPAKRLLFPNAKYVVGREAFARAVHPHARDRASFIPELPALLQESKRLVVVDGESSHEVLPRFIKFSYSQGHTPGHMHTQVSGNKFQIVFAGDLIPGLAWVHLPVTMGYDRFAEKVIDEKQDFYESFANDESKWIFYTHDTKVAMSRVVKNERGRYMSKDEISRPIRWDF